MPEPKFVMATNLSGEQTSHQFGGLALGQTYTVSLVCVFGAEEFSCGSVRLSTEPPSLVSPGPDMSHVYSLGHVATTWREAEADCVAGGGHLVSLASLEEEQLLVTSLGHSDLWTGGNMCPDSPAPRHSMWTDGSLTDHTHFAPDSGLEGGHCCVKTGRGGWRGGTCDTLLHGACESHVSRVLAHPSHLTVTPGRGLLAVRWDKVTGQGWLPSRWLVRCCHVRTIGHVSHNSNDTCVSEVLQSKAVGVIFKKLSRFSEYNVTVTSYLDHFNQSDTTFKLGRTRNFFTTLSLQSYTGIIFFSSRSRLQLDRDFGRGAARDLAQEILHLPGGQPGGHFLARGRTELPRGQQQWHREAVHHPRPQLGRRLHSDYHGPGLGGRPPHLLLHSL